MPFLLKLGMNIVISRELFSWRLVKGRYTRRSRITIDAIREDRTMSFKKIYKWKDNRGKDRSSVGIVLTDDEKQALCRKNLALVAQQKRSNNE
jgi:hypothetical protein